MSLSFNVSTSDNSVSVRYDFYGNVFNLSFSTLVNEIMFVFVEGGKLCSYGSCRLRDKIKEDFNKLISSFSNFEEHNKKIIEDNNNNIFFDFLELINIVKSFIKDNITFERAENNVLEYLG